jgi:hypothetical protein
VNLVLVTGHAVKHRSSPDAIDAGVSTDAVILLVKMLRKLSERLA